LVNLLRYIQHQTATKGSEMADLYSILAKGQPTSYISDLNPAFSSEMSRMLDAMPENLRGQVSIFSGARSNEKQAQLWQAALAKYGSPGAARHWVAPPGHSRHNEGLASDLRFASPDAEKWVHANATNYGLTFPMAHEPWHIEPVGARDGTLAKSMQNALADPTMQPVSPMGMPQQPMNDVVQQKPEISPLGGVLAGFMNGMNQPSGGPTVTKDTSPQTAMLAAGLADRGRQLNTAFLPNVDNLLAMPKRPAVLS
jgi:hypothetical protein